MTCWIYLLFLSFKTSQKIEIISIYAGGEGGWAYMRGAYNRCIFCLQMEYPNNKGGVYMRKLNLYIINHGHHMGYRASTQELKPWIFVISTSLSTRKVRKVHVKLATHWPLWISLKSEFKEFVKRSKHFSLAIIS